MRVPAIAPYLAFAFGCFALEILFSVALDGLLSEDRSPNDDLLTDCFVAVPLALLAARRLGRLNYRGLFATSMLAVAVKYLLIFAILNAIATHAGSTLGVGARFVDFIRIFDLRLWLTILSALVFPVAWLFVINRFDEPAKRIA